MYADNKKHAGLTEDEWILLAKHQYVLIELYNADESVYFLDDIIGQSGEFDDIKQLLPDPKNMTRVLPMDVENIIVEVTSFSGIKSITFSPFKLAGDDMYYRIIGVKK